MRLFTCQKLNTVINLILVKGIFEEVVAFEILVMVSKNDCVFEVDGGWGSGMVVNDFVGFACEEEIKIYVVFASELRIDWLCWIHKYCSDCPTLYSSNRNLYQTPIYTQH